MVKKILLSVAAIFSGLNLGAIACASPIYLLAFAAFSDGNNDLNLFAATALLTAAVVGVVTVIYMYKRKREHEKCNSLLLCFAWSFIIGALIAGIALFVFAGQSLTDIGQRLV